MLNYMANSAKFNGQRRMFTNCLKPAAAGLSATKKKRLSIDNPGIALYNKINCLQKEKIVAFYQ